MHVYILVLCIVIGNIGVKNLYAMESAAHKSSDRSLTPPDQFREPDMRLVDQNWTLPENSYQVKSSLKAITADYLLNLIAAIEKTSRDLKYAQSHDIIALQNIEKIIIAQYDRSKAMGQNASLKISSYDDSGWPEY